jgi:hypothetical protein
VQHRTNSPPFKGAHTTLTLPPFPHSTAHSRRRQTSRTHSLWTWTWVQGQKVAGLVKIVLKITTHLQQKKATINWWNTLNKFGNTNYTLSVIGNWCVEVGKMAWEICRNQIFLLVCKKTAHFCISFIRLFYSFQEKEGVKFITTQVQKFLNAFNICVAHMPNTHVPQCPDSVWIVAFWY